MSIAPDEQGLIERRRRASRTALVAGLIALGIYVAFILSGVLSR
ncbi:hypothetical protein [Pseudoxanthomonas composti]|jgi:hypothetical protein|nr:hypothetical protein [Pseudoxanthomonas composti]